MTTFEMTRSDALLVQKDWLASRTMFAFIVAESALFAVGFLVCFGLAYGQPLPLVSSASLMPSPASLLVSLLLMACSTVALRVSQGANRHGDVPRARAAIGVAILLGLAFLGLHALEEGRRLGDSLSMASIFDAAVFSLVILHTAHLILGLFMLTCVSLLLASAADHHVSARQALRSVALYWYFVGAVWVCIVGCFYIPRHFHLLR